MTLCPPGYCADVPDAINSCEVGRTGRLCGSCLPGYSQTLSSAACVPDESCSDLPWVLPLAAGVLVVYFAYFVLSDSISDGHVASLVVFYQLATQTLLDQTMPALVKNVLLPVFDLQLHSDSDSASDTRAVCPFRSLTT